MAGTIMYDWDNAVIVIKVPVHHTATASVEEIPLSACQLAELIACHLVIQDGTISGDGKGALVLAQETPNP